MQTKGQRLRPGVTSTCALTQSASAQASIHDPVGPQHYQHEDYPCHPPSPPSCAMHTHIKKSTQIRSTLLRATLNHLSQKECRKAPHCQGQTRVSHQAQNLLVGPPATRSLTMHLVQAELQCHLAKSNPPQNSNFPARLAPCFIAWPLQSR
jgi:hypothetical protein